MSYIQIISQYTHLPCSTPRDSVPTHTRRKQRRAEKNDMTMMGKAFGQRRCQGWCVVVCVFIVVYAIRESERESK
jgi:hypothetical protein